MMAFQKCFTTSGEPNFGTQLRSDHKPEERLECASLSRHKMEEVNQEAYSPIDLWLKNKDDGVFHRLNFSAFPILSTSMCNSHLSSAESRLCSAESNDSVASEAITVITAPSEAAPESGRSENDLENASGDPIYAQSCINKACPEDPDPSLLEHEKRDRLIDLVRRADALLRRLYQWADDRPLDTLPNEIVSDIRNLRVEGKGLPCTQLPRTSTPHKATYLPGKGSTRSANRTSSRNIEGSRKKRNSTRRLKKTQDTSIRLDVRTRNKRQRIKVLRCIYFFHEDDSGSLCQTKNKYIRDLMSVSNICSRL